LPAISKSPLIIQVPLQTNFSDCGLFLVHYAYKLLNDPEGILKFVEVSPSVSVESGTDVQRRLPHKGTDERKQFEAEVDSIWGINRNHMLRDEWQAKINSLKETYEGLKAEKPKEDKPESEATKENGDTIAGGLGEESFEEIAPGNGIEPERPGAEPQGVQNAEGDVGMEQRSDHIVAEQPSKELADKTVAQVLSPQSPSVDHEQRDAIQLPQPLDTRQVSRNPGDSEPVIKTADKWEDELDDSDGEDSRSSEISANPRPANGANIAAQESEDSGEGQELEDDAVSSVVTPTTPTTVSGDNGGTEPVDRVGEMGDDDAVDPALVSTGQLLVSQTIEKALTNLDEPNGGPAQYDDYEPIPITGPWILPSTSPEPSGDSASIRMIQKAGLKHSSNPNVPIEQSTGNDPGRPSSSKPGDRHEDAIDIDSDNEVDAGTAPGPSESHIVAERPDRPTSAASVTGRGGHLFTGMSPASLGRKSAAETQRAAGSPLIRLAKASGHADLALPSTSERKKATNHRQAATSPLTSIATSNGETTNQHSPSFRAGHPSNDRPAKKAPLLPPPTQPPWLTKEPEVDSSANLARTRTPVSGLKMFAHPHPSPGSTAPSTPVWPHTGKQHRHEEGSTSQSNDDQSDAIPAAMKRPLGGLERLHHPDSIDLEPSPKKRHMSLDKRRPSKELPSSQSDTSRLDPSSVEPRSECDIEPDHLSLRPSASSLDQAVSHVPTFSDEIAHLKGSDVDRRTKADRQCPSDNMSLDTDTEYDNSEIRAERTAIPEELPRQSPDRPGEYGPSAPRSPPQYHRESQRVRSTASFSDDNPVLLHPDGQTDDLESHSDNGGPSKQSRRSSRIKPILPEVNEHPRKRTGSSSSDGIEIRDKGDVSDGGRSASLPEPAIKRNSTQRPKTYSGKGKGKGPNKSRSSAPNSTQTTLPNWHSAASDANEAGPSTNKPTVSAKQKRQNEQANKSAIAAKRQKYAEGAPGHTPARMGQPVRLPRLRKRKEAGDDNDPIDVSD
jgi:hypothetical protein